MKTCLQAFVCGAVGRNNVGITCVPLSISVFMDRIFCLKGSKDFYCRFSLLLIVFFICFSSAFLSFVCCFRHLPVFFIAVSASLAQMYLTIAHEFCV